MPNARGDRSYPFDKLKLPSGELMLFQAATPTFHRHAEYGIVVSQQALYWHSAFWSIFSPWKRYPLQEIEGVRFLDSRWFPSLAIRIRGAERKLRTAFDFYSDSMNHDRCSLREAADYIAKRLPDSRNSTVPINVDHLRERV